MASPCEVLAEAVEETTADEITRAVAAEAWRIEDKFSRYRDDNIIYRINHAAGKSVRVDTETSRLFDFADELYRLSEGMFDVTSGVLREVWRFDGSDNLPSDEQVERVVERVGWDRVSRISDAISLPEGMEVDLGGIGKEYAVDRCVQIAAAITDQSVLVNFGGDLAMTCARANGASWAIGRLVTGRDQVGDEVAGFFELYKGAIATSGDANRYLLKDGIRYSHILNPRTGWPVIGAPHTVSVAAPTCLQAGMMSTLAMLQGEQAQAFLEAQGVDYWID
jgi:thiamine biosynthesis lipoprotein